MVENTSAAKCVFQALRRLAGDKGEREAGDSIATQCGGKAKAGRAGGGAPGVRSAWWKGGGKGRLMAVAMWRLGALGSLHTLQMCAGKLGFRIPELHFESLQSAFWCAVENASGARGGG